MTGYDDSFEEPVRVADRLTLDLDGWEGPLDLLLTLARGQKVDLARISILAGRPIWPHRDAKKCT